MCAIILLLCVDLNWVLPQWLFQLAPSTTATIVPALLLCAGSPLSCCLLYMYVSLLSSSSSSISSSLKREGKEAVIRHSQCEAFYGALCNIICIHSCNTLCCAIWFFGHVYGMCRKEEETFLHTHIFGTSPSCLTWHGIKTKSMAKTSLSVFGIFFFMIFYCGMVLYF